MANFSASTLATAQAIFAARMQQAEFRLPDIAAMKVANLSAVANPLPQNLRTKEERPVKAYMPIRKPASTGGTSRTYNHSGARGDSIAVDIIWSTFSETFSISLKQADNNVINWQEQYIASKRSTMLSLMDRLDAWFVAQMVAKKTHVNAGGGNGTYDGTTTYDYQVPLAEKDYFFQNAKATMQYNGYRGLGLIGLVDDKANMLAERLLAQGSANATNYGFQFSGMNVVGSSREIISGVAGSGLFFQAGFVSLIPWIPKQNRKPINPQAALSYNGDFGSTVIPELGLTIAEHVYATRADTSGEGGDSQDLLIQEELSVDVGLVVAPLSTAGETPIFSVTQLAS